MRVANRHAAALRARGAREAGGGHYPLMVALHAAFLRSCFLEAWFLRRPLVPWLAAMALVALLLAQGLRYWTIRTLGERWTTRVLVVPGSSVVTGGPYRLIRHPNYVAIVTEFIAIPLVHTAWLTALVFSAANAALLAVRIRAEERLLREIGGYAETLDHKPRFLPGA